MISDPTLHRVYVYHAHSHPIIVHKLLRKVIHHTFDPASRTFGTTGLAGFHLAANLVSFAFCACELFSYIRRTGLFRVNLTSSRFRYPRRYNH